VPNTIRLNIDDRETGVPEGATLLEAARKLRITLPTLCSMGGRNDRAACRLCLVRVDRSPQLVSACSTPARAGMRVVTGDPQIIAARRVIAELTLAEHGQCGRADCEVERLAASLGVTRSRFRAHRAEPAADMGSDYIDVDAALCVHCDRCIRACSRDVIGRCGRGATVGSSFGVHAGSLAQSDCTQCGDCVHACPASALRHHPSPAHG